MIINEFQKKLVVVAVAATIVGAMHVSAADGWAIEEVVVTAQKRAQSVNDIGVSASAFGGDDLKRLKVESAIDLGAHTPGLVAVNATSGGTPIFAIRGVGLDDFSANNTSGVGVYTDEVFASAPALLNGQIFDVERVEVLKGPQGTLYGKNTTGGAINFISNKPTEEFEGYIEADYSRWDRVEITSAVSGAINESMRGRIAVNLVDQGEGWQKDVNTGKEYGKDESQAIRGLLDFDISSDTSGFLKAYYTKDNSTPLSPHAEQQETWGHAELNSPTDPGKVAVGDLDIGRDEEGFGLALTLNMGFEPFTLTSITAWDTYEQDVVDNYDGTSTSVDNEFLKSDIEQFSQELRFTGNTEGAFSWILGFNYSVESVEINTTADDSFLAFEDPSNAVGADLLTGDYTQVTESYGVYLHTDTELNDELTLTVGVRYSLDDRSFDGRASNHDLSGFFDDTIALLDESHDEDGVTGKIGLDWAPNNNWLIYSNVATSYKTGIFYGSATLDSDPGRGWGYAKPEEVVSFEAGFKATLLDDTLQINGAAFMLEYENRQSIINFVENGFSTFLGFDVVDVTMINVPESEVDGAELDIRWLPFEGLDLRFGAAYLNSKVTKAPTTGDMRGISDDASQPSTVDHVLSNIAVGAELAQSPEWSYNSQVSYEWVVGNNLIARVQTSYSWLDEQGGGVGGDPNLVTETVSSLDAQVSVTDADDSWAVTLWGKNLEGDDAETYAFSGFAGRVVYRKQPASYGVTVNYNF